MLSSVHITHARLQAVIRERYSYGVAKNIPELSILVGYSQEGIKTLAEQDNKDEGTKNEYECNLKKEDNAKEDENLKN